MRYTFDDICLDTDTFELAAAGRKVHAEPQVFAVLAYLIAHRERVVSKEELLDGVWGGRFVSESALTSRLKSVRRAVGDDGRSQRIVRTVHSRGYQFVADVTETKSPGHPVSPPTAPADGPAPARPTGTVTFLFTDIVGSTRLWDRDPVGMQRVMARHDELLRTSILAHGGTVFTTAGDAFCAAFARPVAAVRAAIDAQIALGTEDWNRQLADRPRVRMALHTGDADERDGDYFGPPLNRCARLVAAARGGQILMSLTTEQLVGDQLPPEVELRDLGSHRLKDLERPERIFQVVHGELHEEFGPLINTEETESFADLVAEGTRAHREKRWTEALTTLTRADGVGTLDGDGLARCGESAWWLGRFQDSTAWRQRAYMVYSRESKPQAAARVAVHLADTFHHRVMPTVARAWAERAEGLLEDHTDTVAYGYLLRWKTLRALEIDGEPELAMELAEASHELGRNIADQNLQVLGLLDMGRARVAMGDTTEGLALIDDAMMRAVGAELDEETTGRSYCYMLSICSELADFQRASEWNEAASAWSEARSNSPFPGVCRIHRAEQLLLRGQWEDAQTEARQATTELVEITNAAAAAWYQLGVIELRSGRHGEAEAAFKRAHEQGAAAMPGLARLRIAQGDVAAAEALLADALGRLKANWLTRASLLPTWVEIELIVGDVDAAIGAVAELEQTAAEVGSAVMSAWVAQSRALIDMAEARWPEARAHLDCALSHWLEMRLPYEAAQCRLLIARTCEEIGNHETARLELESARSVFERLGAHADLDQVNTLLDGRAQGS